MINRLADETSPYLRQHADNPVHWWPWCAEALETARAEDKPVLLSIGYSACHWCHVMAHESFEDEAIAALMNARYVNIKVDREERPDLDKVYQLTHQIMAQRPGGWPLTVVLDPETQAPFMAGTYFPREAGLGMPAFPDVLQQVADWYAANRHQLAGQKQRLDEVFARLAPRAQTGAAGAEALDAAAQALAGEYDREHGGLQGAPKFPHPTSLELAARLARRGHADAGEMLELSLAKMTGGGLFDHIGGGFFRYCVDTNWEIPHFEKMLYDNGPLLSLTARAGGRFHLAANATADWVLHEMRAGNGGFYSSLDADSEGQEGRYYVWTRGEVDKVLGDDSKLFAAAYGLEHKPNFEGAWHLQRAQDDPGLAERFALTAEQTASRLADARRRLAEYRAQRLRPERDDKILTAWNALMVTGLVDAARHLGRDDCLEAADAALAFLHKELWRDGRLLAVHAGGRSHTPAFLDDYAFLLDALLATLAYRWNGAYLAWAQELADALLAHFEDCDAGGFFFTADDHEALLHRPKPLADESTPAGNGVAAAALQRLGWLLGEPRYLAAAEGTLTMAADPIARYPLAHASLVGALDDALNPPAMVILRGEPTALERWRQATDTTENAQVFAIRADAENLPPALAQKQPQGEAVAYVCRGTTCSPPISDVQDLSAHLGKGGNGYKV